jgi:hypothetical protein
MTNEDLNKYIDQETSWLKYYGSAQESEDPNRTTRITELYNDAKFYDRLIGIGYTKKVIPLYNRCPACCITSSKPVLESTIEELEVVSGPRNHEKNIYTPLEYMLANNLDGSEKIRETLRS